MHSPNGSPSGLPGLMFTPDGSRTPGGVRRESHIPLSTEIEFTVYFSRNMQPDKTLMFEIENGNHNDAIKSAFQGAMHGLRDEIPLLDTVTASHSKGYYLSSIDKTIPNGKYWLLSTHAKVHGGDLRRLPGLAAYLKSKIKNIADSSTAVTLTYYVIANGVLTCLDYTCMCSLYELCHFCVSDAEMAGPSTPHTPHGRAPPPTPPTRGSLF